MVYVTICYICDESVGRSGGARAAEVALVTWLRDHLATQHADLTTDAQLRALKAGAQGPRPPGRRAGRIAAASARADPIAAASPRVGCGARCSSPPRRRSQATAAAMHQPHVHERQHRPPPRLRRFVTVPSSLRLAGGRAACSPETACRRGRGWCRLDGRPWPRWWRGPRAGCGRRARGRSGAMKGAQAACATRRGADRREQMRTTDGFARGLTHVPGWPTTRHAARSGLADRSRMADGTRICGSMSVATSRTRSTFRRR